MLVAGDLNVDSRDAEHASMLSDAGLVDGTARTDHPYTDLSDHYPVLGY